MAHETSLLMEMEREKLCSEVHVHCTSRSPLSCITYDME